MTKKAMGASTAGATAALAEERLSGEELRKIDAYWRACNYLAAGMIYLRDNPLLREPLKAEHVKERLLGHWGASPGLSFIYVHLNRLINKYDTRRDLPGRPRPRCAGRARARLPRGHLLRGLSEQERGRGGHARVLQGVLVPRRHRQPLHARDARLDPRGRRAGLRLSHAFGAAFDNPDLLVAVVVGDGEAETGPLATSWHSNKFLNPIRDGAVLPILHLNGYKINNPTLLARIPHEELEGLFRGYGWTPHFVEGATRSDAPGRWRRRSRSACWRSAASSRRRAPAARPRGRAGR